ncbi:hypothetical protein BDW75DRAFT_235493 [Aspergillus navahoensis]
MHAPLYSFTVPVFITGLQTLSHILSKGESYFKSKGLPLSDLINASLHANMNGLGFQIRTDCNTAKLSIARITQTENIPMKDEESTVEELQARIAKTIDLLREAKKSDFVGREGKELTMNYVREFALPNFHFHTTMAYAILRSQGVELGKRDFLPNLHLEF